MRARMQVSARDLATMAREAEIMTWGEGLEGSFIVPARLDGERNWMTGGGELVGLRWRRGKGVDTPDKPGQDGDGVGAL